MANTSYSEKLTNPLWQKKRLEILNRDSFTCQLCSDTETTLHIHHKEYIKGWEPWEYEDDNFQTLCKHCHKFVSSMTGDFIALSKMQLLDETVYFFVMVNMDGVPFLLVCELTPAGQFKDILGLHKDRIMSLATLFEHSEKLIHG